MTPPPNGRASRLRHNPRRRAKVSLTPLIDVVFILLVFFMLASSFQSWRHIPLDAPARAGTTAAGDGPPTALLRLTSGGDFALNGAEIARADLRERLAAFARRTEPPRLLVAPGDAVAIQETVAALDLATAAGLQDVRLLQEGGTP